MSRPSTFGQRDINANQASTAQRNLTLTEELEKLEQSITLTLQGNFHTTPLLILYTDPSSQKSITISVEPTVS